MARFDLDAREYERLLQAAKNFEGDSEKVINEVLHDYAGEKINDAIMNLLPVSGKTWKGKKPAAKKTKPFVQKNENLSVTVKTKNNYHYLYFPDDGSSTRRHAGNQQFMAGGAERVQDKIIDECISKLVKKLEE